MIRLTQTRMKIHHASSIQPIKNKLFTDEISKDSITFYCIVPNFLPMGFITVRFIIIGENYKSHYITFHIYAKKNFIRIGMKF
jgi:hypothetical protein